MTKFCLTPTLARAIAASGFHAARLARGIGLDGPVLSRLKSGSHFGFVTAQRVRHLARLLDVDEADAVVEIVK